jgi:spectinomycin phosphotransferase
MNEKPPIPDDLLLSVVNESYRLSLDHINFLPLGADVNSAAYRLTGPGDSAFFLKLRKGPFEQASVTVPFFLHERGISSIIAPLPARDGAPSSRLGEYTLLLYPFISGENGFQAALSSQQKIELGAALRGIHTVQLSEALLGSLPRENFGPRYREALLSFQAMVELRSFDDPVAAALAALMQEQRREIDYISRRAAELALSVKDRPFELVLCHSDLHGGNILLEGDDHIYIVDWDNPILAPRERDLMFIGAGIDEIWDDASDQALFYQGYGPASMDQQCLAYYRYERIVQDMVAYCEQLLLSQGDAQDRLDGLRYFASNFEPRGTIAMARLADPSGLSR